MPNKLKGLVSKKKIRYQRDGFDLDLTYIVSNIIAMGYPAQNWEGIYRNHIDDVVNFFKKYHEGHYIIYNLCNERHIDEQKFGTDTINHLYPFDDHNPPRFSQMLKCCDDIKSYLEKNPKNIVAVQCKAGKGRTGVIVCSCLLLLNYNKTATDALRFYGRARTTNGKGVTIPSQIRYIYYFDHYFHNNLEYKETRLKFNHLILEELPFIAGNGYEIQVVVYGYSGDKLERCHSSQFYEVKKDIQRSLKLYPEESWIVSGDLKFQIVLKSKFGKKENLCHCWLNTFFVVNKPTIIFFDDKSSSSRLEVHYNPNKKSVKTHQETSSEVSKQECINAQKDSIYTTNIEKSYKFTLHKPEIDKANKDQNHKIFPSNFAISFFFEEYSSVSPLPTKKYDNKNDFIQSSNELSVQSTSRLGPSKNEDQRGTPDIFSLDINTNQSLKNDLYVQSTFHLDSSKDGDLRDTHDLYNLNINTHRCYLRDDNSDNADEHSESSESSTKQSPSDVDELSS